VDESIDIEVFKGQLQLDNLAKEMARYDQVDCPVKHNFAPGIYVRELFIPEDTFIMGKRHRHETCNILLKGEMSLYMGPNIPAKKIFEPLIFNSKPFVKKLAYTHTDCIFLNIHPTDKKDLEKIEDEFIITDAEYKELTMLQNKEVQKCLGY